MNPSDSESHPIAPYYHRKPLGEAKTALKRVFTELEPIVRQHVWAARFGVNRREWRRIEGCW